MNRICDGNRPSGAVSGAVVADGLVVAVVVVSGMAVKGGKRTDEMREFFVSENLKK
jgi:hypothetical protein